MIAGHSASATISPRCSRWPLIRPEVRIRFSVCVAPFTAVHRSDLAAVQIATKRANALSGKNAVGCLANHGRLSDADGCPILFESEWATAAAGNLPPHCQLASLSLDSPALVVALLTGNRSQNPRHEAPVVVRQVDVSGDGREVFHLRGVTHLEELLQLLRLSVQAIQMPYDDRVDSAAFNVTQQLSILRAGGTAVSADIVVHVLTNDLPVTSLCERAAILDLPANAELLACRIRRDARVDRGSFHAGNINARSDTGASSSSTSCPSSAATRSRGCASPSRRGGW